MTRSLVHIVGPIVVGALIYVLWRSSGLLVLRLSTPNAFSQVMATLEDSEKSKAGRLSKGTAVRLVCEGSGMVIGSPSLDECTIDRAITYGRLPQAYLLLPPIVSQPEGLRR